MTKTGKKTGVMVSPRNGAVCPTGAHPGNTGGKPGRSGPKPDRVRRAMLNAGANRIKVLKEIADGDDDGAKTADRVKAIDTMFKYGIGPAKGVDRDVVVTVLRDLALVVQHHVRDGDVLDAIKEDWKKVMSERLGAR